MSAAPQLTNVDRVLWPAAGFTKGDMLDYYRAIAPVMLPHLAGRPLTLRRFPEGVEGPHWYQTNCRGAPRVVEIPGRRGGVFSMCVVDDVRSLLWVVNLGAVELHPHPVSADDPGRSTLLVFDLDPGDGAGLRECCEVALLLRDRLPGKPVVKWSGSLGLHVYVPIDPAPDTETKAFARALAEELAVERPDLVVAQARRAMRAGRVFVDWLQNDATRSTVAPYSLRAAPWPLVSAPLTWAEVESRQPPLVDAARALARVERFGDLFT